MTVKLPMIHNAFYTRNTRRENLKCLDGLPQGPDMDMYDYEWNVDGGLKAIHKKVDPEKLERQQTR